MTKQETIELLSEIRSGYNCFDESERRFYEALSVAIEALTELDRNSTKVDNENVELSCSEEPNRSDLVKESSDLVKDLVNDCISRQDAIDALMNDVTPYGLMDDEGNIESGCKDKDVVAMLYNLPSAQQERKKGEWIWDDEMGCFICSNCEQGWKKQPTLMGKPLFDWCPVCGSDNRGEQE